jgi:glycine cleavage system H protein
VIAVNKDLPNRLETLNADPYGAGWLVKVRLVSETALKELLDHKAYQKQCAEEAH